MLFLFQPKQIHAKTLVLMGVKKSYVKYDVIIDHREQKCHCMMQSMVKPTGGELEFNQFFFFLMNKRSFEGHCW